MRWRNLQQDSVSSAEYLYELTPLLGSIGWWPAFVLSGATVGVKVGKYDHRRWLVIDPVGQFASYTGSAMEN